MLFDLHVHTTHSVCSRLTLGEILEHAGSRGLDGVCITDHDTMAAGRDMREGVQENGLCLIMGMEYETTDGDFLIFGPFEGLAPGLPARELLGLVRCEGGVAVAAHPFRAGRGVSEWVVRKGGCSIVERVNGRNTPAENRRAENWFDRYPLRPCCGSDAHSLAELGQAPTRFLTPVTNRTEFVSALTAGLFEPAVSNVRSPSASSRAAKTAVAQPVLL